MTNSKSKAKPDESKGESKGEPCHKNCRLKKCCAWETPICAMCLHFKTKNGEIYCVKNWQTDYKGNPVRKKYKVAIYNPLSKLNSQARTCPDFERDGIIVK
jgi:hypothetical protein